MAATADADAPGLRLIEELPQAGELRIRQEPLEPALEANPLGNPVDEQIDDLVLAPVLRRKFLIVFPEPLPEFGNRRAREQKTTALVGEDVFDVAHRQSARQKLHRQSLERLGAILEAFPDFRMEPFLSSGYLRRSVLDEPFRRLQTTPTVAVAAALAGLRAVFVLFPAQGVGALRLQRFFDDEPRGQLHQVGTRIGTRQAAFDQVGQGLASVHRCLYSLLHGTSPRLDTGHSPARFRDASAEDAPLVIYPASLGLRHLRAT